MTSTSPKISSTIAATRVPIRAFCQMCATSNATGAISGRMYCGLFDCEIEKKRKGIAIQSSM